MAPKNPQVADHPANRVLLDYLQAQARRPSAPADYVYTIDEWVLHTHPDLLARLKELAPDDTAVIPLFGVPVLAAHGVVAVAALGTDWLMVRLPQLPADLEPKEPIPTLTDHGWQAVSAWQSEIPSAEGKRRLTQLINDALRHARNLNQ